MSKLKPVACAKCGNQPQVVDKRIRFAVICECQEPFNYSAGNSVGFLDHIEDESAAQIAFDAVNVNELSRYAIEAWNTSQRLTTITKQRDELQKYLRHIHDYMLVKNKSYREGDLSAEVGKLLSNIKEQK